MIVITQDHDIQRNIMTRFITTGLENDFHKSDQSIFHDDLSKSLTDKGIFIILYVDYGC